jgi:hypothetical protein
MMGLQKHHSVFEVPLVPVSGCKPDLTCWISDRILKIAGYPAV